MTKILFLDCDGTIREPKSGAKFISAPDDQRIIAGADKAIAHYHSEGYKIIGITNQGGVAAGHKSLEDAVLEQRITLKLFPEIIAIYFCPDFDGLLCWEVDNRPWIDPQFYCNHERVKDFAVHEQYNFRKPGAGMILAALNKFNGTISDCWMVGDRPEDEQAAAAAGINFMWADIWRQRWK